MSQSHPSRGDPVTNLKKASQALRYSTLIFINKTKKAAGYS
jgi:hypothetical protein